MTTQLETFPCIVKSFQPFPKQQTAYAVGRAVGEDGLAYLVKGMGAPGVISATEYVCTALAEVLNLPTAPFKVLKMPNGELVFGSQILPRQLSELEQASLLFSSAPPNGLFAPSLKPLLSQLFAFDLFIGNVDRHASNFMFTSEEDDSGATRTARLRVIDFDQADLLTRSKLTAPMHSGTNTVVTARSVRRFHTFDGGAATEMLTRLKRGREVMFERAVLGLPPDWLSANERSTLLKRVASAEFGNEITMLGQGLMDGTHL